MDSIGSEIELVNRSIASVELSLERLCVEVDFIEDVLLGVQSVSEEKDERQALKAQFYRSMSKEDLLRKEA